MHDVTRIPLNFVRDGGERYGRVAETLHQLRHRQLQIPIGLFPQPTDPLHSQRSSYWLFAVHLLLVQLFDLCAGPELLQFLMRFFTHTSALTDDERETAVLMFGSEALRYSDIRIAQGGILNLIFRLNGNLAFTTWDTINLPQQDRKRHRMRCHKALLVHELTHVFQYHAVGTRYMTEAIYVLFKTKRDCYKYGGIDGLIEALHLKKIYRDFNREQQAQIVQDYFSFLETGQDVSVYQPFLAAMRQKKL